MKYIVSLFLFLAMQGHLFSQKSKAVAVTGTVYISSSTSNGVYNSGGSETSATPFKKQPLYFVNGTDTVIIKTDSVGVFNGQLSMGSYTIYQESALKQSRASGRFGTAAIEVSKKNAPYKIELHNSFNMRSSMGGKAMPSGNSKTQKTTNKKE